ncbi:MAG: flagellar basal-body rod protein FlgF [Nitrospinae bacterium]|nr:flagellar basal-body rod protein FlgF [Nitrospinota bacterium]
MDKGIYVTTSGSLAQERMMDIITNNLANMNTHGYKADRLLFSSYMQKSLNQPVNPPTPEEIKKGFFTKGGDETAYMMGSQTYTDFSQGALQATSSPFDIALDGDGFIAVQTPEGERYTRGGNFKVSAEGELVTSDGYPVLDEGNATINIGADNFAIQEDGSVVANAKDVLAKIKVVNFPDKGVLQKTGRGLYQTNDAALAEPSTALVKQGYLEGSNINPVVEMTRMITAMRTYEAFQKSIHSHDDMTQRLINDVAKP